MQRGGGSTSSVRCDWRGRVSRSCRVERGRVGRESLGTMDGGRRGRQPLESRLHPVAPRTANRSGRGGPRLGACRRCIRDCCKSSSRRTTTRTWSATTRQRSSIELVLRSARAAGDVWSEMWMIRSLAFVDLLQGRFPAARAGAARSLAMAESIGVPGAIALNLAILAWLAAVEGRESEAREHAARADELAQRGLGHALSASTASGDARSARAGSRAPTRCDREAPTGRGPGRAPRRA